MGRAGHRPARRRPANRVPGVQELLVARPQVHPCIRGGLARRPICARRPCTTLSKPALDKSACITASRAAGQAPRSRIALGALSHPAPTLRCSRLVLHGTIGPCLACLRTSHLARLSCSPIRTRKPRPRRSVRSLTSCSRVPSLSLKAPMPLRRCARCASTPTRDPGCHRRLCGRRDRVRYATRPGTREAAPDALISGTHHPKVLADLARERCTRRPPPARSSTGPLDRAPHAARRPDARPDRLPGRDDRDSVRADRGADPPFLP
jgi:hypothetical protein